MKRLIRIVALSAVVGMGQAQARADQTNLVQNLSFRFLGSEQGSSKTNRNVVSTDLKSVRIGSRDVLGALGAVAGSSTSSNAHLVLITPLPDGQPEVAVRDGTNSVDVTVFFFMRQLGGSETSSELNTKTGRYWAKDYSIEHIILQDSDGYSGLSLHFDVSGLAVNQSGVGNGKGQDGGKRFGLQKEDSCKDSSSAASLPGGETEIQVYGAGDQNGTPLILQGTVGIRGGVLEVVPSSTGGGGGAPGV